MPSQLVLEDGLTVHEEVSDGVTRNAGYAGYSSAAETLEISVASSTLRPCRSAEWEVRPYGWYECRHRYRGRVGCGSRILVFVRLLPLDEAAQEVYIGKTCTAID